MFKKCLIFILLITAMIISSCGNNSVSENGDGDDDPVCGNGIIEEGEICDGGSKSCIEIDSSEFIWGIAECKEDCSGWEISTCEAETIVCDGDYKIRTKAELDEIMLCLEITGDLLLGLDDTKEVYLPFLEKTGGSVVVLAAAYDEENREWILYDDFSVEKLALPKLEKIGKSFGSLPNRVIKSIEMPMLEKIVAGLSIYENEMLELLDFSNLEEVGTSIGIHKCPKISSISFPELRDVYTPSIDGDGSVQISKNDSLIEIDFPKLERVGRTLAITNNPALEYFEFPSLKQASNNNTGVWVDFNHSLVSFSFPVLENIYGELMIRSNLSLEKFSFPELIRITGDLWVLENNKLKDFSMPKLNLVGSEFVLQSNDSLTSFELESLSRVGYDFWITSNPELPTEKADALVVQILERDGIGGEITVARNKDAPDNPPLPQCTDGDKFCLEHKGLYWSDPPPYSVTLSNAIKYCEDLGGRLPTISELKTLIQNCPATETGGSCSVTESCLSYTCWLSGVDDEDAQDSPCRGCFWQNSGKYSVFGDMSTLWSSSVPSEDIGGSAWLVDFRYARIVPPNPKYLKYAVRCVRVD